MAEKMAALELLNSKPKITNSKRDWLNYQGKKAEFLTLRQSLQLVLKMLILDEPKKMGWLSPGNFITRIWESHDIHEAFPQDSCDQQEKGLFITGISLDVGLIVSYSGYSYLLHFLVKFT